MKDREALNPRHITFTEDDTGTVYSGTWDYDDSATVDGTPLEKNTFLKDSTAALYGYSSSDDPLVDTVLANIGNNLFGTPTMTDAQKAKLRNNIGVYSKQESAKMSFATTTLSYGSWLATEGGYTQTVRVTGVSASTHLLIGPAPVSYAEYNGNAVRAISQATPDATSIQFFADGKPTSDLSVNVIIFG